MRHCINCKSEETKPEIALTDIFGDKHNFNLCNKCGVYFLNPLPTQKQLEQAYDESYYGEGDKKFTPLVEAVVDYFRKTKAKKLAGMLPKQASILDIGCGNGNFLKYLSLQGDFNIYGIEPEGKSADRASEVENIHLHRGYFQKGVLVEQQFDLISLIHVFEHLPNPEEALELVTELACQKAWLKIEIPNVNSWQAKIFKGKWFHFDPPRHLNMYPPKVLIGKLKKKGWHLEEEKYFSVQFNPYGTQQSLLNCLFEKRDTLYEHLKGNKSYTHNVPSYFLFSQKLFHWCSFPLFVFTDIIASVFKKGATVKLLFKRG